MHYTFFPYIINRKLLDVKIIFTLFVLFAILFIEHYFGLQFFIPFFLLCADGGSSDGADGGTDSGGPGGSTPFISTWNGNKFVFENDFLFGYPHSLFPSKNEGVRIYESGAITPDLYKIQNNIQLKNGYFVAQIKEIEPEESYIDHLSLFRVTYPKNAELIVDSKFKKFHLFEKKAIKEKEGVEKQSVLLNGNATATIFGDTKKIWQVTGDNDGYMLKPQKDILDIRGFVTDKSRPVYLLLRAHYRDWTVGEIFDEPKKEYHIPAEKLFGILPHTSVKRTFATIAFFMRSIAAATNSLIRHVSGKARETKTIVSVPGAMQYTNAHLSLPPW